MTTPGIGRPDKVNLVFGRTSLVISTTCTRVPGMRFPGVWQQPAGASR